MPDVETETINGVTFYYSPGDPALTDDVLAQLHEFSLLASDKSYSVSVDNGSLLIY